jgi:glycosyltransferase involved in cell wall biosynthesis
MCNALDDRTRIARDIKTDSPAATKKIIMLCKALRISGVNAIILSMGRGGEIACWKNFSALVRRVDGVPIIYIPFSTIPIFSHLLSSTALAYCIFILRIRCFTHLIYYNRTLTFIPSLLLSRVMGYVNILDLEDGETSGVWGVLKSFQLKLVSQLFDKTCIKALLACRALKAFTSIRPVLCYYGTASSSPATPRFQSKKLTVLMSGTLSHDTGAELLIDAILMLRQTNEPWVRDIRFEITGKGESLGRFHLLASELSIPNLVVHGRLSGPEYSNILSGADIGLSLKLIGGLYANTTFPSKVIEYAASGVLVLTTEISDVRKVLGEGAIYLKRDDPSELIKLLKFIALNQKDALNYSIAGSDAVQKICMPRISGEKLSEFIFGSV